MMEGAAFSPRRVRAAYASRACNTCRQRKLKCDGSYPCARCARQKTDCFYTGARRGQGSNRPDPSPASIQSASTAGSDAVGERLIRVEARLEELTALLHHQAICDDLDAEHETHVNLDSLDTHFYRSTMELQSQNTPNVSGKSTDIRIGTNVLAFPTNPEFNDYVNFFFADINACHPAVNEADFRYKTSNLIETLSVRKHDVCFLALNYIIFACADILRGVNPQNATQGIPGWKWYVFADNLVGKRKTSSRGDICLVQVLLFQAFYLTHADKPNAAYSVIGLACRLCFQLGLHHQLSWGQNVDGYTSHMRQRLFWTVYFTDRRISLSCGRPYGIRDSDISLNEPSAIDDASLRPGSPLPGPNPAKSCVPYLRGCIAFARLGGEIWDRFFSSRASGHSSETIIVLDAKLKHWIDSSFPDLQMMPRADEITIRHRRQRCLIITRFAHLRLLLRRSIMVSLTYDSNTGSLCGELAGEIITQIGQHRDEISQPSSFRFHMAVSLGGAVLTLAALLVRDLARVGLHQNRQTYLIAFRDGLAMLHQLAVNLQSARRILADLAGIVSVVDSPRTIDMPNIAPAQFDTLFPYTSVDFAQQNLALETSYEGISSSIPGALNSAENMHGDWEMEFGSVPTGYGVPWL